MQFDIYANPRGGEYPFLLDIQAELLSSLATRVVVPLMTRKRLGRAHVTRLNPVFTIEGVEYAALFQEMAAVPRAALGARVASMATLRAEFIAAMDLLLTGA